MRRFLVGLIAVIVAGTAGFLVETARVSAQAAVAPSFSWLKFGEVMPEGWLKAQMTRDIREGFAGHLDQLAPQANTDIFASGRNAPGWPNAPAQAGQSGETERWGNGETEGVWRRGYILMAYMSGDPEAKRKADAYVAHILRTQDKDGYIGIFSPELRYTARPGDADIWTQTTMLRGLLAYYELTGKPQVLNAVERAARLTMSKYGPDKMSVFGKPGAWIGIGHDLMFVDVVEQLYELTGNTYYRDFGLWLYQDFCAADPENQGDTTVASLLDLQKPIKAKNPSMESHIIEQFRVPLWAYYISGGPDYKTAFENAFTKVKRYVLPGGAMIGDEDIGRGLTDPTKAYYEYCQNIQEMLVTWCSAEQKVGKAEYADSIEKLIFNAAEGGRTAGGKEMAMMSLDNQYRIGGERNFSHKFSPTHSDVAICCPPGATYTFPAFVRGMWMRTPENGLVATLYGPSSVHTKVKDVKVQIEEKTDYPFSPVVSLTVSPERPVDFPLQLRNPAWSKDTQVKCEGATASREGDYFVIRKEWKKGDRVSLEFSESIEAFKAGNNETYLQKGPLVYALRIPGVARNLKKLYSLPGFADLEYYPAKGAHLAYALDPSLEDKDFGFTAKTEKGVNMQYPYDGAPVRLDGKLINLDSGAKEDVQLIPMGSGLAILRRVTFPVGKPENK